MPQDANLLEFCLIYPEYSCARMSCFVSNLLFFELGLNKYKYDSPGDFSEFSLIDAEDDAPTDLVVFDLIAQENVSPADQFEFGEEDSTKPHPSQVESTAGLRKSQKHRRWSPIFRVRARRPAYANPSARDSTKPHLLNAESMAGLRKSHLKHCRNLS